MHNNIDRQKEAYKGMDMREGVSKGMMESVNDAFSGKDSREAMITHVNNLGLDTFTGKDMRECLNDSIQNDKGDELYPKQDNREKIAETIHKSVEEKFEGLDCREKLDVKMPHPKKDALLVETQATEENAAGKKDKNQRILSERKIPLSTSDMFAQLNTRLTPFKVADYLRNHYTFKALSNHERLAVYDTARHYFLFMKKRQFIRFILKALDGMPLKERLTKNLIDSVFLFLVHDESLQVSLSDFNRQETLVNFQNGVLDLDTMQLRPHASEDLFSYVLAVKYNSNAQRPERFFEMLSAMFKGKASRKLCMEYMGYLLSNNTSAKKLVFFLGVPNSGKSTLARLLSHIYGQEFVSAVPLERFGGRFELGSTMNRRLNICPEVEKISPTVVRAVKAVSGGDKQLLEDKFEDVQFGFINLKFLWSANMLPEIPARLKLDEGFFSRIGIVYFPNAIAEANRQENLDVKLFEEEGEGIVFYLMDALHKWHRNGHVFTKSEASEIQLDLFRGYDTRIERTFAKKCLVFEPQAFISNDALCDSYASFCKKCGKPIRSVDELKALLVKIFPILKKCRKRVEKEGNPIAGILGVRLRPEEDTPI